MFKSFSMELAGRTLTVEVGRVAKQANGAAFMHYGDTVVLSTATASEKPREGIDFFPLSVEFEEKMYSVGKIPGGFNKREGKASEHAILTSRVIDRPMRPLFPKDYRNDVTLNNMVMSVDPECDPEVVAMLGSAIATCISDIPFDGPCAMTQIGMIDGEFIVNPTLAQKAVSDLKLTVASTREKVIMIEAGANEIYKVGGAQAIGALAYGTESIPKVDKIVGPGNIFVALAKRCVFGHVSIDSVAGPSEIMVLADETANARYVAADLLSQAEHDEMASAILVTTSEELAKKVSEEVDGFVKELSRKDIIQKSLDNYGYILVADTMQDAIDTVNEIASEHLEVVTANPFDTMTRIQNAGAIFLGSYSSEPLGDYFAGPNHVLPTNGTAKFFSPLSVDDFIKKSSIIYYSREALEAVHEDIIDFAEAEYLTAHANSIKVRFEK